MASRTFVLACALPVLALLLTSLCLQASADFALPGVVSSALTAAASSGDLALAHESLDTDAASIRRDLADDDEDKKKAEKKKAAEKKKKKEEAKKKKKKSSDSESESDSSSSETPAPPTKPKKSKTPPAPTTPTTPTKTPGGKTTPGGTPATKKPLTAADKSVISLLEEAAGSVDAALASLKTKTYTKSLTDTAAALRNSAILVGGVPVQRAQVPQQITNAISTIDGVSVMLDKVTEKKTLSALATAKALATQAQGKYKA